MTRVWAAACKSCGKTAGVRYSKTYGYKIEVPNPSQTTKVICTHCQAVNEFSDAELTEVDATVLEKREE